MGNFVQVSFPCRILSTSDEVDNVMSFINENSEIIIVSKNIDVNTFQPEIVFLVGNRNTHLNERMFFKTEMNILYNSKSYAKFQTMTDGISESFRKIYEDAARVTDFANFISYQKKRLDVINEKYDTTDTLETPFKRLDTYAGDIKYSKLREAIEEWDSQDNTTF